MAGNYDFEERERLYMGWCEFRKLEEERRKLENGYLVEDSGSDDLEDSETEAYCGDLRESHDLLTSRLNLPRSVCYVGGVIGCFRIKQKRICKLNGGPNSARRITKPSSYWESLSHKKVHNHDHESIRYIGSVEFDKSVETDQYLVTFLLTERMIGPSNFCDAGDLVEILEIVRNDELNFRELEQKYSGWCL